MIAGIIYASPDVKISDNQIKSLFNPRFFKNSDLCLIKEKNLAIGITPTGVKTIDDDSNLWQDDKKIAGVVFLGNIFNKNELISEMKENSNSCSSAQLIGKFYDQKKSDCFSEINGNFIIGIWNRELQQFILARDHLGVEPLYYFWDGIKLIFASSLKALLRYDETKTEINYKGLHSYLLFNYNPSLDTIISGIKNLPPGNYLQLEKGNLKIKSYWKLSFEVNPGKNEEQYIEELLPLMRNAVQLRIEDDKDTHGAFLSGGMDSSSVVGLMSSFINGSVHTFSFRCRGKSFDESHYAKIVSDRYHAQHHLVEFSPEEIISIAEIVNYMEQPFCDIGIEIATYILGRQASEKTSYILSGDGGDELFAGHPVYQADTFAQKFEKLPKLLKESIINISKLFPDTEKKKSLIVKAKRFAYSYNFPPDLYSNRWRIYYTDKELTQLVRSDTLPDLQQCNPLEEIVSIYQQANGNDYLSKTLYGDYYTVVGFYLRRMQLLRTFGIEGRFPMLDPRLVEYAATIPSELKIRGSETKYILHKTMTGILPDEIVYRKDKLGHSVPMKNWLRDIPLVKDFVTDVLSEATIKKRGYFNANYIQHLLNDHLTRKQNNSHRIWALLVLELWLQKNIDQ